MTDAAVIMYGVLFALFACVAVLFWQGYEIRRQKKKRIQDLKRWIDVSTRRIGFYETKIQRESKVLRSLRKQNVEAEALHEKLAQVMYLQARIDEERNSRARSMWELTMLASPTINVKLES